MQNTMMKICMKEGIREMQMGIDGIIESRYCDDFDWSFRQFLSESIEFEDEDGLDNLYDCPEYEYFQSCLLALIRISVQTGFQIGFNIKPFMNIIQIKEEK